MSLPALQVENFSFGHHILQDSSAYDNDWLGFRNGSSTKNPAVRTIARAYPASVARVLDFVT
jgi:hypothetical protein